MCLLKVAFPLRWIIVGIFNALQMPLPALPGGVAAMGTVGLTASAGIAGWIEFLLLRRSMQQRIGSVPFPFSYQIRLWLSAIAAGVLALGFDIHVARAVSAQMPLCHVVEAILVCGVFGIIYFASAMLAGIPEARATLGRFLLRSRT